MAKKKELPKAMRGGIKPLIRAIFSGSKVVKYTKPKTTAIIGDAVKAGKKGYSREVATYNKAQEAKKAAKAPERVTSEKAAKATKSRTDWMNAGTPKPAPSPKPASGKKTMTPEQKKKLKKVAIVGGAGAAVGTYKYANRKRRTLND